MNGEASPRILVLYHSRHGNTRLLAEAIAAATGAALLELPEGRRRGDQPALRACGLLFLGGPVHFGGPAAPLRALAHRPWPAEAAGAAMAPFCSYRFWPGAYFRRVRRLFAPRRILPGIASRSPLRRDERAEARRAALWARATLQRARRPNSNVRERRSSQ